MYSSHAAYFAVWYLYTFQYLGRIAMYNIGCSILLQM